MKQGDCHIVVERIYLLSDKEFTVFIPSRDIKWWSISSSRYLFTPRGGGYDLLKTKIEKKKKKPSSNVVYLLDARFNIK